MTRSPAVLSRQAAAALFAAGLALFPAGSACAAANPALREDFDSMMEWLSNETAEGLSFHSSVAFDPPVELARGAVSVDGNLGVGTLTTEKNTFPRLRVKTLQDLDPEENFSDVTPFPDMTAHLRLGLPARWETGLRLSNMTVPRHPISSSTEGSGQSNIYGLQVRRHYFGGRSPLLTLSGTVDYLHGGFKFYNGFKDVEVTDTLFLDSANEGRLSWDIKSAGVAAMASKQYGRWTPYWGAGYHYSRGYVRGRLTSKFNTSLIPPVIGAGTERLRSKQVRVMVGTMREAGGWSWYGAVESLAFNSKGGRTFAAHLGFSLPLLRADRRPEVPKDLRDAPSALGGDEAQEAPSSLTILH